MLWFFKRSDERLELETRFDNEAFEYVMIVRRHGRETIERYSQAAAFHARLVALEQELLRDDWHASGTPRILAAGWPVKRPPSS
jgi:hypothetical protein